MKSLERLAIWQKLTALGLVFLVLFAIPTGAFLYQEGRALARSQIELAGVDRARTATAVMKALSDHRALSAGTLGGVVDLQGSRQAAHAEVQGGLKTLAQRVAAGSNAEKQLVLLVEGWRGLSDAVAQRLISVGDSHYRHTELVALLAALLETVRDDDGLAVDPDLKLHYAAETAFVRAPALGEAIGQVASRGVGLLAARAGAQEDRVALTSILEKVKEGAAAMKATAAKSWAADAMLRERLAAPFTEAEAQSVAAVRTARVEVVFSQALDASAGLHAASQAKAVAAQLRFGDAAADEVRRMLVARIAAERLRILAAIVIAALAFAGALAFGIWTGRSIARPLGYAVKVADGIAAGRLDHHIDPRRAKNREAARLMASFDAMQSGLSGLARDIQLSSAEVQRAAGQVAQGNAELSARTESQASSLEETAATMEQLTATVRGNAESARRAGDVVNAASEAAMRGSEAVDGVVATMGTIDAAGKRIADIISTIDAIAFQTNILALNAAVEAARAGEQGRGFGVVASEVRSLAQRSAAAAREIRDLVRASVEASGQGSSRVSDAGRAMDEIMESVQRVAAIFGEISAASSEQGHGIEQVNRAVTDMDRATQENAALVGEATAASQSLQEQARHLARLVARFRLAEHPVEGVQAGLRPAAGDAEEGFLAEVRRLAVAG